MSTPSKRRAAKRAWMLELHKETNRLIASSRADCNRRIDDLTRHVPTSKSVYRDDGKQDVVSFIEQFPKPSEAGEYQKYMMPGVPEPMFDYIYPTLQRAETIDFHAKYHAIKRKGPYGDGILNWVTWEPVLDKEAQRAESKVISNLRIAQSHLHYVHGHTETLALIEDCIGALQSQRGDYAR